ncbi:MAG: glycosyltransferase [Chlorobiaceae bacterium]
MKESTRSRIILSQVVVLLIFIVGYATMRIFFLTQVHFEPFERIFSTLFLAAELFVLFHAVGFFLNIISENRRHEEPNRKEPGEGASVAILIPARHEPKAVIESTLLTCLNLEYPRKQVYLLDDSSIESYKEEARELAARLGATLFTRASNRGAKAGMINDAITTLDEKYVAIFDADQNPMPSFLDQLIPFMEGDERLAFVQTPQFYSNTDASRVATVSHAQQAVFFEYVCNGKSSRDSMFCCGTNVVIRRNALCDVAGFDEGSVTEDLATSLNLHLKQWKSLYYNKAYTYGMAPEDLGAYFTQQNRWATGSINLFRKLVKLFFTDFRALKPIQWYEYLLTSTYYFIGWAYLILIAGPIIYIFSGLPWFFMEIWAYVLLFIPYLLLSLIVFYSGMKRRHYPAPDMFRAQMLTMISIPVHIRASILGLLNVKARFQVTPKGGSKTLPYPLLWAQLLLWGVHVSALTWGVMRLYYEHNLAVGLNVLWVGVHFIMFSSIFYFNRE